MTSVRALAHDWLPPIAIRLLRSTSRKNVRFKGNFATWEEASAHCTGYDAEAILERVLAATLEVKCGKAAFERDSVLFVEIEHPWPVLAGLLRAAARNGGRLNILDFGGSLGSSYFQTRSFCKSLLEVRWGIVEQPHYVRVGRKQIQDEHLRFYGNITEYLKDNQPDVILLSSVLQYLPNPDCLLDEIKRIKANTIIIDRTIINHTAAHRIYAQQVPATIYSATYPCWSISEPSLISQMKTNYKMEADFQSLDFPALRSIRSEFKGYIFDRVD